MVYVFKERQPKHGEACFVFEKLNERIPAGFFARFDRTQQRWILPGLLGDPDDERYGRMFSDCGEFDQWANVNDAANALRAIGFEFYG